MNALQVVGWVAGTAVSAGLVAVAASGIGFANGAKEVVSTPAKKATLKDVERVFDTAKALGWNMEKAVTRAMENTSSVKLKEEAGALVVVS